MGDYAGVDMGSANDDVVKILGRWSGHRKRTVSSAEPTLINITLYVPGKHFLVGPAAKRIVSRRKIGHPL
jgi:hypothetical protein